MPSNILSKTSSRRLEEVLCEWFGRRYCCLCGRGTTAVYLGLKALHAKGRRVVLPDILCPSPANACLYAGLEPIFCDVNLDDFSMDIDSLRRILAKHQNIVAVMPVHIYGHVADMDAVTAAASEFGVKVIEDAAQAMGGSIGDCKVGSLGDLSIMSFGRTKILDVGGGGAVLTDDEDVYLALCREAARLPAPPGELERMYGEYRDVYYTLKRLTESNEDLHQLFLQMPSIYKQMYLFSLKGSKPELIASRLKDVSSHVETRRRHAALYHRLLDHPRIIRPKPRRGSVPWRYTFLFADDVQQPITDALRHESIDVSNWYPCLHKWYESGRKQDPDKLRNSTFVADHVMNLWVEPGIAPDAIHQTCERIHVLLKDSTP